MIKFNLEKWVHNEDLKEVNISSLLFDDCDICNIDIGNIGLSLTVRGDIRILDENENAVYKCYSQYSSKLKELIKNGKDLYEYNYIVDMNNWFEIFIDEIDENGKGIEMIDSYVADIEGELDEKDLKNSLIKFMIKSINDCIGIEDIDMMKISGNEERLLNHHKIVEVYNDYKELAEKKLGKANEELGKELFMNNESYFWIEVDINGKENHYLVEENIK